MDQIIVYIAIILTVAVVVYAAVSYVKNGEIKKLNSTHTKIMADLIDRQDKRIETLFRDYEHSVTTLDGKYTESLLILNAKYSKDAIKMAEAHAASAEAYKEFSSKIGLEEKIAERMNFMRGAE